MKYNFVIAFEETLGTVFDDALEGERNGFLQGKPICRRVMLPPTAPPICCAPPRPDPPVVCPGFGFDKYVHLNRRTN